MLAGWLVLLFAGWLVSLLATALVGWLLSIQGISDIATLFLTKHDRHYSTCSSENSTDVDVVYVYSDQFLHSVRGSVTGRLGLHHVQGSRQSTIVERIHLLHLNDLLPLMARQGSLFLHVSNEYQPKGGDALRLGSKGRYGLCVGGRYNCVIPLLHTGHT